MAAYRVGSRCVCGTGTMTAPYLRRHLRPLEGPEQQGMEAFAGGVRLHHGAGRHHGVGNHHSVPGAGVGGTKPKRISKKKGGGCRAKLLSPAETCAGCVLHLTHAQSQTLDILFSTGFGRYDGMSRSILRSPASWCKASVVLRELELANFAPNRAVEGCCRADVDITSSMGSSSRTNQLRILSSSTAFLGASANQRGRDPT